MINLPKEKFSVDRTPYSKTELIPVTAYSSIIQGFDGAKEALRKIDGGENHCNCRDDWFAKYEPRKSLRDYQMRYFDDKTFFASNTLRVFTRQTRSDLQSDQKPHENISRRTSLSTKQFH